MLPAALNTDTSRSCTSDWYSFSLQRGRRLGLGFGVRTELNV